MKSRLIILTTWLSVTAISSYLFISFLKVISKSTKHDIYTFLIVFAIATLLLTVIHLTRRNYIYLKTDRLIHKKVIENHISTEFYFNYILPKLMEMQNPFILKMPTVENYFDEFIIEQYFN